MWINFFKVLSWMFAEGVLKQFISDSFQEAITRIFILIKDF